MNKNVYEGRYTSDEKRRRVRDVRRKGTRKKIIEMCPLAADARAA